MNKFLLSILSIISFAFYSSAATETFDFTAPQDFGFTPATTASSGVDVPTGTKFTKGGITIEVDNKTANVAKFWTGSDASGNAIDLRIYKNATFTISSTETINSIILDGSKVSTLTPSIGTINSGMWSGNGTSIVFTATGTLNINSIEVSTMDAGEVFTPSFSLGGNIYYDPIDVEITCETAGASIYYTTTGEDPTESSTLYSAPIHIASTTTVKAIAMLNGRASGITEAYFGIETPAQEVNSIAEFIATNTSGTQNGKAIRINAATTVSYAGINKTNNYLYLTDDSGAMSVYLKGAEFGTKYKNGDIIPAGIVGYVSFNGGEPQMSPSIPSFKAPESNSPIEPIKVKISEINSSYNNKYIVIEGVTIDSTNKKLTLGDESFNYYLRFDGVTAPATGTVANVAGIVNTYNNAIQLYPTDFNHQSGVTSIITTNTNVYSANGSIIVNVNIPTQITIISIDGKVISNSTSTEYESIYSIENGIYIVKVGSEIYKVSVK